MGRLGFFAFLATVLLAATSAQYYPRYPGYRSGAIKADTYAVGIGQGTGAAGQSDVYTGPGGTHGEVDHAAGAGGYGPSFAASGGGIQTSNGGGISTDAQAGASGQFTQVGTSGGAEYHNGHKGGQASSGGVAGGYGGAQVHTGAQVASGWRARRRRQVVVGGGTYAGATGWQTGAGGNTDVVASGPFGAGQVDHYAAAAGPRTGAQSGGSVALHGPYGSRAAGTQAAAGAAGGWSNSQTGGSASVDNFGSAASASSGAAAGGYGRATAGTQAGVSTWRK